MYLFFTYFTIREKFIYFLLIFYLFYDKGKIYLFFTYFTIREKFTYFLLILR